MSSSLSSTVKVALTLLPFLLAAGCEIVDRRARAYTKHQFRRPDLALNVDQVDHVTEYAIHCQVRLLLLAQVPAFGAAQGSLLLAHSEGHIGTLTYALLFGLTTILWVIVCARLSLAPAPKLYDDRVTLWTSRALIAAYAAVAWHCLVS